MRGQSSLELLVTVGIVVAFTIPVLFLLFSFTSVGYDDTAKAQADASARTLADTVNSVYAQGPGAQRHVLLNTPAATEEIYLSGGEAVVSIDTNGGTFHASHPIIAEIHGNSDTLGSKNGLFLVTVENVDGKVEIE